jgi:hypothetical protein
LATHRGLESFLVPLKVVVAPDYMVRTAGVSSKISPVDLQRPTGWGRAEPTDTRGCWILPGEGQ